MAWDIYRTRAARGSKREPAHAQSHVQWWRHRWGHADLSPLWFWSAGAPARPVWAGPDPSRTTRDAGSPADRRPPGVASKTKSVKSSSPWQIMGFLSSKGERLTSVVPNISYFTWPPPNSFFTVARVAAYSIFCFTCEQRGRTWKSMWQSYELSILWNFYKSTI